MNEDVRNSWFMQQHFSKEELEKLYQWDQEKGCLCKIIPVGEGFIAYHIADTDQEIDLCFMREREMLLRWISRLGYETEDGETFKGDQHE